MRTKIDYGIDLGTTNSSIARMENGVPVVRKSDKLKDTIPSCVSFNKRKDVLIGDAALNVLQNETVRSLKTFEASKTNTFIEFKRTMGTTHTYDCVNMGKSFTSTELSAEVLKKLKTLIQDEELFSIVITVPAKFGNQQKEATMQAAKLAGFQQVQLLQEPVAAATAYGLSKQSKDGFWLVFDFGGGTFDAALVKSEEGILSVKDTAGDNWLGGKNLDEAIVDQIIIPYLQSHYSIDNILKDANKKQLLRATVKRYAEEAKNQLSFTNSYTILSNLGDLPFEDTNGEEPEIDIVITDKDLEKVIAPIFQKAIDITQNLLKRNNLNGSDLHKLILVGGPTHSPILRQMLRLQITPNVDPSVDPMTVVAKGAALYASTIDVAPEIQNQTRDETKLQLEIKYEAVSAEKTELVNIKILKDKSKGNIPDEIFIELYRSDGGWNSPRTKTGAKGSLLEVDLQENCSNIFVLNVCDNQGNRIDCEPSSFNILQGIGGLDGMQVLPSHVCIVKYFPEEEKNLIFPVKGLEKNKRYPAIGVTNGLRTRSILRPGMIEDTICIPIYEGEYNAKGTNPELNNPIFEVIITGEKIPSLIPEGSTLDITIKVDKSGLMKFSAYFPAIDYTEELDIPVKETTTPDASELTKKIKNAKQEAAECNTTNILENLENLENQLKNEEGSPDGCMRILNELRKELLEIEELKKENEFSKIEEELRQGYSALEEFSKEMKYHGEDTTNVEAYLKASKIQIEMVIKNKNKVDAKRLIAELHSYSVTLYNQLSGGQWYVEAIYYYNTNFHSLRWKDKAKAKALIDQGLKMIDNGQNQSLRSVLAAIWELRIDKGEFGEWDNTVV
ncbi:MAG: Hsp70 family protein [Bacteroidales bacterium]|jgi:molecular chaperone DnaK|nr:Hsp70 family protein [Bacteroidales bacterium]